MEAKITRQWDSFLFAADEWVINYSLPVMSLTSVKLFSIGHVFELYLKAANTKTTNDIDRAAGFGHDIPKIWMDCKSKDSNFFPNYELRESVLKRDL
jgi:hypothetical protein